MTAATSAEISASLRQVFLASVIGALGTFAGQPAHGETVVLRHQTTDRHLTIHSLSLSRSSRPHALISSVPDRYARGPYVLSVVSEGEGPSITRNTPLRTLMSMGPLAELAVGEQGDYALATSDERGLLFSLHAADGTQRAELKNALPDQVPIALFATTGGFILVSNRGHYLIDEQSEVLFEEAVPEGAYTAAAVELPVEECSLVSILVDPAAIRWTLRRHCLDATGFKLHSSVAGPAAAAANHLLRPSASAREVLISAASATERGKWVTVRCALADLDSCASSPLPNVPAHPILAARGLPAFIVAPSTAVVLAPTDDGRSLWLARARSSNGRALPARVLSLPGVAKGSTALLESLAVRQSEAALWFAVAYSDWDPAEGAESSPRQRSSLVVSRIDPAGILPPRR